MNLTDFLGFLAFGLSAWAAIGLALYKKPCWLLRIVSMLLWLIYSIKMKLMPSLINDVVFLAISCFGWYNWRKSE